MPTIVDLERLGWGNPDETGWYAANIVSFEAAGRTWRVNRAVKPLFHALILLMERNGVDIDKGLLDDWSYANRDIRGYPGSKSWHSVGCAVDIDAVHNALGQSSTTFPIAKTRKAAEDCSLTWGYTFSSRPDPMHFEFNGGTRDVPAALARLKARYPLLYRKVTR